VSDVPLVHGRELQQILLRSARGRSFGERLKPWLGLRPGHLKPATPGVVEPRTGLSMGEHCELLAKESNVGRAEQDQLAYESHLKAAQAWKDGFFGDLVTPFGGLSADNNVRADSSLEKMAKLRTVYDRSPAGTLTAANSTPLTDEASCVLLASEDWAKARALPVLAWLTSSAVAAVDRDKLGRAALGEIDRAKMNPKGSSVAVGHPFAATGARIVATLAKQLAARGSGRGLISICTAGGMGVTAILER